MQLDALAVDFVIILKRSVIYLFCDQCLDYGNGAKGKIVSLYVEIVSLYIKVINFENAAVKITQENDRV